MVHDEDQHVLALGELQQRRAQQRAARQAEGAQRLLTHAQPRLLPALVLGHRGQVHHRHRHGHGGLDDLHGPLRGLAEGGAQRLLAAHQLRQGALQGAHVHRALQDQGERQVVQRAVRVELIQEPQALLRQRRRQVARARHGNQRRHLLTVAGLHRPVHPHRQLGQRRGVEQVPQRQLHVERGAHAADGLGGQQGVSAELEEVVGQAHRLHAEHGAPDSGQQRLRLRARGDEVRTPTGGGEVRRGQGPPVHLAVGGERHGVQHHHGRGHHVLGQRLLQGGAQRGAVRLEALVRDDVAHQPLAARAVLAGHDDGLAHRGQLRQRGLHLAQLDAEAAHLHLRVRAAEVVQRPVLAPAHHVAGAVHPGAGHSGPGVRQEAVGGEARAARVAARHAHASHVQLSLHAHGHGLAAHVQHVRAHVAHGAADGGHAPVRLADGQGGHHRGLRGAVAVVERAARRPTAHHLGGDGLTAGDDGAQGGVALGGRGRQRGRGDADDGERLVAHQLLQRRARHQLLHRRQHQRASGAQRGEDLLHRQVEGEAGELQHAAARANLVDALLLRDEVGDAAVLHGGALGRAGAAGGVEQVGQVVRGHARHRCLGALT